MRLCQRAVHSTPPFALRSFAPPRPMGFFLGGGGRVLEGAVLHAPLLAAFDHK